MKSIIFIFVLSSAAALPSRSNDNELSARELAYHLGVTSWVSKLRLQDRDIELQVLHVVNGKVLGTVLVGSATPTDREFTRVAIEASQTPAGTKLSIQTASGPWGWRQHTASLLLNVTVPLPQIITEGDYVLGGDIPTEVFGQDKPAPTIKNLKNGLLLRVAKSP